MIPVQPVNRLRFCAERPDGVPELLHGGQGLRIDGFDAICGCPWTDCLVFLDLNVTSWQRPDMRPVWVARWTSHTRACRSDA